MHVSAFITVISALLSACLFVFILSQGHLFSVCACPPIPHFLLFRLVWLWGLGCRDNRGHRPVSLLFAKFLLLQAYCTLAAGIGKSLSLTTIPHPHLVRDMQAWMSSQKHKQDTNHFLSSILKILDMCVYKRQHIWGQLRGSRFPYPTFNSSYSSETTPLDRYLCDLLWSFLILFSKPRRCFSEDCFVLR